MSAPFLITPPRPAEFNNYGTVSAQCRQYCFFSSAQYLLCHFVRGNNGLPFAESRRCRILGLIDMSEPKHVYHRNLKPPESQMERIMGIPLLHIRGGQRTYLLGQSNYEGSCVLDLCTPSGKVNISGENCRSWCRY